MEPLMTEFDEERRRTPRRSHIQEHGIVTARVRPGHNATVVDVSAGGALVETQYRLLPGTSIELQIEATTRRALVRGRVLRCAVSNVQPSCVRYRGAIGFDRQLSWFSDEGSEGNRVPGAGKRPANSFRADATPHIV